jgi:antibiotic biosynthesis monooxygenase (ABM) superfamily enzyme
MTGRDVQMTGRDVLWVVRLLMGMRNGKYVKPVGADDGDDEESKGREGEDTIHEMREMKDKSREITIPQPFSSSETFESLPTKRSPFSHEIPPSSSTYSSSSDPIINIVFHTTVPIQHKDYFEKEWLPNMATLYDTLQGFKYRSINLLVRTEEVCEYLVIIACNDYHCFLRWESTPQRVEMLELLKFHGIVTRRLDTTSHDPVVTPDMQSQSLPLRAYLKDRLGAAPPSPPPPSKWKLSVIIFLGVMMNIYLWSYSGVPLMMTAAGLPNGFNLFVSLVISVPILSYSIFPLVMSIPIVSRWLQAPRPEKMNSLQKLLNEGLLMFAPRGSPGPSKETVAHFKKMECRLEATRRVQHQLSNEIERMKSQMNISQGKRPSSDAGDELHESTRHQVVEGIQRSLSLRDTMVKSKSTSNLSGLGNAPLHLNRDDIKERDHGPITVAVAHWVKWEHILDFELWTEEITSAMAKSVLRHLFPLRWRPHSSVGSRGSWD